MKETFVLLTPAHPMQEKYPTVVQRSPDPTALRFCEWRWVRLHNPPQCGPRNFHFRTSACCALTNNPFAFLHGDISVDGKASEPFDLAAGQRPFYLHPIHLSARADAQYHARIVSGEITAARNFHLRAFQVAGLPGDDSSDCIRIACL